ncbi:MAG: 7-cyano-7-deazaguanine synthase QueC [Candidatus Zixiibacteriota bacterium]
MAERKAVVLLSGGLDSAVALGICRADGFIPYALTIDYGQRNRHEIEAARSIAQTMQVAEHIVLSVDLTQWGGSALTSDAPVPTGRSTDAMGADIPITYVPARNTIMLSLAMAWAEVLGTGSVFIGAHTLDYSGYPDCRPEFFRAFETMANLATRTGVEESTRFRVHTPLLDMTKTEIVRQGTDLEVPLALTISCYQPIQGMVACGRCDACLIRRRAFAEAGIADPTEYAEAR